MKQLCQLGFKCPFHMYGYDTDFCTYPHIWKGDICIYIGEDYREFKVEHINTDDVDANGEYLYYSIDSSECPLVESGSKADPITWED